MKTKIKSSLVILSLCAIGAFSCMHLIGCANQSPAQQAKTSAIIGTSESIVNALLPVAATIYGNAAAGEAVQNALFSWENQLNPIVGKTVPITVTQNATGTQALNTVVATFVHPMNKISVADIQKINTAAQIAPALAAATLPMSPSPASTSP